MVAQQEIDCKQKLESIKRKKGDGKQTNALLTEQNGRKKQEKNEPVKINEVCVLCGIDFWQSLLKIKAYIVHILSREGRNQF